MTAAIRRLVARTEELWRFYGVGVVNTAFGYGLFTLFVWAGIGRFGAQALAHVIGMAFNYFMFRRHVFRGSEAAVARYVGAYGVNYLVGLALLAGFSRVIASAYLAGLATLVAASMLNYFVLKFLVFHRRRAEPA